MHFSPLSEAYKLKKSPDPAPVSVSSASPAQAPAPAPAPVPAPAPAPVLKEPMVNSPPPRKHSYVPKDPMKIIRPFKRKKRESFMCGFSEKDKMDLILLMQFLNFAIILYLLWTKKD